MSGSSLRLHAKHVGILVGAFAWLCSSIATVAAAAAPATQPRDRAALLYSQAFARISDADLKAIVDAVPVDKEGMHLSAVVIDDALERLLLQNARALELIHQGADEPRCNWSQVSMSAASTVAAQSTAPADSGNAGVTLAGIAAVDAQRLAEHHQPTQAVLRMCDAMAITRQASDGTLTELAGSLVCEEMSIDFIAEHLFDVPKQELQSIQKRIEHMPQGVSLASATRRTLADLKAAMKKVPSSLPTTRGVGEANAFDSPSDEQRIATLKNWLVRIEEIPSLAVEDIAEKLDPVLSSDDKELISVQIMAILVTNARVREVRVQAKRQMLRAGIQIALGGIDAGKSIRDPFGKGPFTSHDLNDGFELLSRLRLDEQSVALHFVRR